MLRGNAGELLWATNGISIHYMINKDNKGQFIGFDKIEIILQAFDIRMKMGQKELQFNQWPGSGNL